MHNENVLDKCKKRIVKFLENENPNTTSTYLLFRNKRIMLNANFLIIHYMIKKDAIRAIHISDVITHD